MVVPRPFFSAAFGGLFILAAALLLGVASGQNATGKVPSTPAVSLTPVSQGASAALPATAMPTTAKPAAAMPAAAMPAAAMPSSGTPGGAWISGEASHTNGPEGNDVSLGFPASLPNAACGYGTITPALFPGFNLVGISASSPLKKRPMGGCGTCVAVKCADKELCTSTATSITVMVYDTCKDCGANQLNLNAQPFMSLAPLEAGRVKIQYREVPCSFSGNIVVTVDTYRPTSGGWLRLSLKNVNGPAAVTAVQIAKAGTNAWRPMKNTFGGQWEISLVPALPFDLQVTNALGQKVVLSSVIKTAGAVGSFPSTANFKA